MSLYAILPGIAAGCFVATALLVALRNKPRTAAWLFPALLSGAFLGWSAFAVATEGPLGFWADHTRNAWGNQIWFDLLINVGIAWTFIVPKARAVGMNQLPWLALILLTGGIGLLAMLSRYLFLRDRPSAVAQR